MNRKFGLIGLFVMITIVAFAQEDQYDVGAGSSGTTLTPNIVRPQENMQRPIPPVGPSTQNPESTVVDDQTRNQGSVVTPQNINSTIETFGIDDDDEDDEIKEGTQTSGDRFEYSKDKPAPASGIQEVYEISQGDTLWDLCTKLLDNPWFWPKLWSINDYITNPHFIYPGNQLRFYTGSSTSLPRLDFVSKNTEGFDARETLAPKTSATTNKQDESTFIFEKGAHLNKGFEDTQFRNTLFLLNESPKYLGKITHSGEYKVELSYGDTVYVKFFDPGSVKVGQKFTVVEEVRTIKDVAKKKKPLGLLMQKNAIIEVVRVTPKTAECRIIEADHSIRRDFKLVELMPEITVVKPTSLKNQIEGQVVDVQNAQVMASNNDYIFLNRGQGDGLHGGVQLFVVKQGDGLFTKDDEGLPDVIKAKLIVVQTSNALSMAYITDIKEEIGIGDRFESVFE